MTRLLCRGCRQAYNCAAVVLLFYLSSGNLLGAQEPGNGSVCSPPFPAPTICDRAGLDSIQANFVFVVDESGSMVSNGLWAPVREALASLSQVVPASDDVRLLFFAGRTREHSQPWGSSGGERQVWANSVRTLPNASGLHTDLGRALEQALDLVSSEPPDRQQFVIIVTDGSHDPEQGSAYAENGSSDAWAELRQRAGAVIGSRPVTFTLLRVSENADDRLLQDVIPEMQRIDAVGAQAFRAWLERYTRAFQVTKLQLAIEQDRSFPAADIKVDSTAAPRLVFGRASNVATSVETERRLVGLVQLGTDALDLGDGVYLEISDLSTGPGTARTANIRVTDRSQHPLLPPGWARREIDTFVAVLARLEPSEELGRIAVPADVADSVRVRGAYAVGGWFPNWPTYLSALLVTLLALAWTARAIYWGSHRPSLAGAKLTCSIDGGPSTQIALEGQRSGVTDEEGNVLFHLRAYSHRGRTRIALERSPPTELHFERKQVDERNLSTGTAITTPTAAGNARFTLMKSGRH